MKILTIASIASGIIAFVYLAYQFTKAIKRIFEIDDGEF